MSVNCILFSTWRSSCSYRVRIALNLKRIPYEINSIDIVKSNDSHHRMEYCKINPMGQVPALQIDGNTVIDSLAIMHYLEETRPEIPLLPQDPLKRCKVREICQVIISGIQPLQNVNVLMQIGSEKGNEWAIQWITKGFTAIEKLLSFSAGKFCVGDEITMADCCLVPQVFNARRYHVDLNSYPNIVRISSELEKLSAFCQAHPLNQSDCPAEFKTERDMDALYEIKNLIK